ncbi:MAG: sensor histidine kinase, partial [Bacteroidota bacterium]
ICIDLKDNLGRITQHGHRAVEIVRSMAEHSASFGTDKQQVTLKSLLEDAVNVTRKSNGTELPEEVIEFKINITEPTPVVNAVYGDLFRVMINLLRNATLAIADKHATGNNQPGLVEITCSGDGKTAEVLIRDNGIGISDDDRTKVFLPFYTTRAAGKGVGLGLSISHQIVSAYGGTIELLPAQNGTAFRMVIPA